MPCPPAWSLPPPCTPIEWYNTPPFEATMPCDHNPVTIFPNAFTYIAINGEQVMTLGAVSLVAHTSGVLPIDRGGTGGTTPEQARTNLGLGSAATSDASDFATAAQGALATTALQPGDDAAALGSGAGIPAGWGFLADGVGGADWGAIPAALPAATQAEMEAGTESALRSMSPLLVRQGDDARFAAPPVLGSVTPNRGEFTEVRLNNTADAVNFERLSMRWAANIAAIDHSVGGIGVARDFSLTVNSIPRVTIRPTNNISLIGSVGIDSPTVSVEMLAAGGWTVGAGWTEAPAGTFTHTSGTATLSHNTPIISARRYLCSWTITGRTAGSVTIGFGSESVAAVTETGTFGPTANSSSGFVVTPTNDFNGTITLSLLEITAPSFSVAQIANSNGVQVWHLRAPAVTASMGAGVNALTYAMPGAARATAVGANALQNLTTAVDCSGFGANALQNLTIGSFNTAVGVRAGARNNADAVARNMVRCVFVGFDSRVLSTNDVNSIVIGADGRGRGSNTTVIGSDATILTRLQGTVETSLDFESITNGSGVLLRSPNGTRYRITVNDAGAVIATAAP